MKTVRFDLKPTSYITNGSFMEVDLFRLLTRSLIPIRFNIHTLDTFGIRL